VSAVTRLGRKLRKYDQVRVTGAAPASIGLQAAVDRGENTHTGVCDAPFCDMGRIGMWIAFLISVLAFGSAAFAQQIKKEPVEISKQNPARRCLSSTARSATVQVGKAMDRPRWR
jgi:hypothetical protein